MHLERFHGYYTRVKAAVKSEKLYFTISITTKRLIVLMCSFGHKGTNIIFIYYNIIDTYLPRNHIKRYQIIERTFLTISD